MRIGRNDRRRFDNDRWNSNVGYSGVTPTHHNMIRAAVRGTRPFQGMTDKGSLLALKRRVDFLVVSFQKETQLIVVKITYGRDVRLKKLLAHVGGIVGKISTFKIPNILPTIDFVTRVKHTTRKHAYAGRVLPLSK